MSPLNFTDITGRQSSKSFTVRVRDVASLRASAGALFGHCSSCGSSISFASFGRFYEFERSPLCAGTIDDPKVEQTTRARASCSLFFGESRELDARASSAQTRRGMLVTNG